MKRVEAQTCFQPRERKREGEQRRDSVPVPARGSRTVVREWRGGCRRDLEGCLGCDTVGMSRDWLFTNVKLSSTLPPTHVVHTFAPRVLRLEVILVLHILRRVSAARYSESEDPTCLDAGTSHRGYIRRGTFSYRRADGRSQIAEDRESKWQGSWRLIRQTSDVTTIVRNDKEETVTCKRGVNDLDIYIWESLYYQNSKKSEQRIFRQRISDRTGRGCRKIINCKLNN